jgi:hypothetical protein
MATAKTSAPAKARPSGVLAMAAAGGAQTRDEQSRPSISLWSLLVRMCIHSPAPYKTDREHNYSAEGRQRLSLSVFSLYWNRWTSLGLLWRVAPAVDPTHMHDRCGSCLLLDRPVWNPIPEAGPGLAPLPLPSSHLACRTNAPQCRSSPKVFLYSFTSILYYFY